MDEKLYHKMIPFSYFKARTSRYDGSIFEMFDPSPPHLLIRSSIGL